MILYHSDHFWVMGNHDKTEINYCVFILILSTDCLNVWIIYLNRDVYNVSIYVPDLKDQTEFPIFRMFPKPNYQSMGQMQYFFLFARNVFSFHC